MTDVTALILAGGRTSSAMRDAAGGVEQRALVPVAGRPMLDYVTEALRRALPKSRLLIAGEAPVPEGTVPVPGGDSLVSTLMNGVAHLYPDETRLLVATADIPFLTPEAILDFIESAAQRPAQLHYPIVPADLCAERFPGMRRTTLRIAEGVFTGGNLVLLDPSFLRANEATLRAAYARRKSIVGLANLLGPSLLLRLVASRLSPRLLGVAHLEAAVARAVGGITVRAITSLYPEIAADVDRPEDLAFADAWFKKAIYAEKETLG